MVVGDAVAELNIQYSTKINEDVIQIDYEDIELVSVSCKDQVFPGEGIVVISGSVSVIRRDGGTPTLLDPIISRLNKSIALRTFIDSKCKHSISNDRISSSNSVNLELLRRRYLGIERRILPGKTVSDGCEAYIFNELRTEVVIARFQVNRCKIYFGYRIFIVAMEKLVPTEGRDSDLNGWIRWLFCSVEQQQERFHMRELVMFQTSLQGDDWAIKFNQSFPYSLQRLVRIGSQIFCKASAEIDF